MTENVAIDGFFCYSNDPLSVGDRFRFLLVLPAAAQHSKSNTGMYICGEVQIVRITLDPTQARYGIACHMTTYSTLPESDSITVEEALTKILEADFV
jgi:hypothetical protein